jgi:hypothetical protein
MPKTPDTSFSLILYPNIVSLYVREKGNSHKWRSLVAMFPSVSSSFLLLAIYRQRRGRERFKRGESEGRRGEARVREACASDAGLGTMTKRSGVLAASTKCCMQQRSIYKNGAYAVFCIANKGKNFSSFSLTLIRIVQRQKRHALRLSPSLSSRRMLTGLLAFPLLRSLCASGASGARRIVGSALATGSGSAPLQISCRSMVRMNDSVVLS